jgi:hypothetical protein
MVLSRRVLGMTIKTVNAPEEILSFNYWLAKLPIEHKVVCGGNHDRLFQLSRLTSRDLLSNAIYLENTGVTHPGRC